MDYNDLSYIAIEQTKATYRMISAVIGEMTDDEYSIIPIQKFSEEHLSAINPFAIMEVPFRETKNMIANKPYYGIYFLGTSFFKILHKNNPTPSSSTNP